MFTKVGVFYAAVNASTNEGINIDIGGARGGFIEKLIQDGRFCADTGTPDHLRGHPLLCFARAHAHSGRGQPCLKERTPTALQIKRRTLTAPARAGKHAADHGQGER